MVVLKLRTGEDERTNIPIVAVNAKDANDSRMYIALDSEVIDDLVSQTDVGNAP